MPPSRRSSLTREAVLRAALELLDREGLAALTMRRLAEVLEVTPMALYNHVAGRDALLEGVADLVAREMEPGGGAVGWEARLRACLGGVRDALLAHPHALPLIQGTRAVTPALLRPMETSLAALADAGLDDRAALEVWSALNGLTLGHVAFQLGGHLDPREQAQPPAESLEREGFPRIAAALRLGAFDFAAAFASALDLLIAGVAARPRPGRAPAHRSPREGRRGPGSRRR